MSGRRLNLNFDFSNNRESKAIENLERIENQCDRQSVSVLSGLIDIEKVDCPAPQPKEEPEINSEDDSDDDLDDY